MALGEIAFLILLALVAFTRLIELGISRRHQRAMASRGIEKRADPEFRWMVGLHVCVLGDAALEVVLLRRPLFPVLAVAMGILFALAAGLRWWAIRSLGPHWNAEVMRSAPLGVVTAGPFRWVRHPNYLGVFVEMIALPMMHTAWIAALFAAAGNAWLLRHRLRLEEEVLNADPAYRAAMAGKPRFVPGWF